LKKKLKFLKKSRLFENATDAVLTKVCSVVKEIKIPAGRTLFRKGDTGISMFIISSGKMLVHDNSLEIAHLSENDVFGEMAALDGELRTATLTAIDDTTLLRINRDDLFKLGSMEPEIAKALIHFLCQREKHFIGDIAEHSLKIRTMTRELEIAAEIQSSFLPTELPSVPTWSFNALFRAAKNVAGDFYDAFILDNYNTIGFVIGDVCGKGVGAAIFMALFRSLVRANMLSLSNYKSKPSTKILSQVLKKSLSSANSYIAITHSESMMFATIFAAVIIPETGEILFINAGHNPPVILNKNGVVKSLEPTGPAVGIFPEIDFSISRSNIEKSNLLLAFTDGVTEAVNTKNEQFSEHRLFELFAKNINHGISTSFNVFNEQFNNFCSNTEQFDDVTILASLRN